MPISYYNMHASYTGRIFHTYFKISSAVSDVIATAATAADTAADTTAVFTDAATL